MERKAKGIWIPIEIWEDKNLNWNEKILFLEIDSYTSRDSDCYISNEYIAKLLGVTETSANKILSSLISKGYVVKTKFDGRKRYIKTNMVYRKSVLTYEESQPCRLEQPCIAAESNILIQSTNTDTNHKEEIDKSISKKDEKNDVDAWIDKMYSIYPTKCPCRNMQLGKCSKDKERIRKLLKSYTKEQIEKVIRNEVDTKYGKSYMSNFSTFLNNFPDPNCIEFGADECKLHDDDKLIINGVEYR